MGFPVSQADFTTNLLLGPRHDTPYIKLYPMPRRASERQQFGELRKAYHTSDPALLPAVDMHPGPVRGGPPAPRPHSKPSSEQQKKRPGQCKVRKNRLHSRGIWAKIASRRIIRAGREVLEHPTPLCRRRNLPHSKITCAVPIISAFLLIYKGDLPLWVCVLSGCAGIYIPARPFCSPRRCPRGPGSPAPKGRSAGEHWHTN